MDRGIDYIGISIVFCCHDGNGWFIMAKRSNRCRDERGRWDIGGGVLNYREKVEDALRREVKEEYCTTIKEVTFPGYRDVHRKNQEGKQTHWIALEHLVLVDPASVAIGEPEKIDALEWFTLDTLPDENHLHSQLPTFFEKYSQKLESVLRVPVKV